MQVATTGLVLRQVKVGEADRILTILTPDLGVVSASARGSLRMKSALFSATGLFCYSEFTLTSGRSHYFVDTAQVWPAIWRRSRRNFPPRRPRPMPSCACFSTACI